MSDFQFISDEAAAGWAKSVEVNQDPYGKGGIDYTRRWAQMMERDMAAGKTLVECAEATSHEADTEGITGFMYGMAVSLLAQTWLHGEELRKWHNKEWGAEGATGTVNPAIISIGSKEGV